MTRFGRLERCLRIGGVAALALLIVQRASRQTPGIRETPGTSEKRIRERVSRLHVPFLPNSGQADPAVAYYAPTFAGTVFVTRDGSAAYTQVVN